MRWYSFIFLLLFFLPSFLQAASPITSYKLDTDQFYTKTDQIKYSFDLNLVLLEKSKWQQSDIIKNLSEVARIYKKCQVRIKKANLHFVSFPYSDLKEKFEKIL